MSPTTFITLGKELGETASLLVNTFDDKKVSFFEGIKLGVGITGFGTFIVNNFTALKNSITDGFTDLERKAVHDSFVEAFDIKDDVSEEKVEVYFEQALKLAQDLLTFAVNDKTSPEA